MNVPVRWGHQAAPGAVARGRLRPARPAHRAGRCPNAAATAPGTRPGPGNWCKLRSQRRPPGAPWRIHADREPLVRVTAAISTPGIPGHLGPQAWSTAAPRRSGCGGGVGTPSPVRPEGTIRARGMPGEAVMCSLLLRRLRSTLPGHPGPGIRPGSGGQLPAEAVASSLAACSRVAHCRQRESAMGASGGRGPVQCSRVARARSAGASQEVTPCRRHGHRGPRTSPAQKRLPRRGGGRHLIGPRP